MSFLDLVEEVALAAEKAKAVQENAEGVIGTVINGCEKVSAIGELHDELTERAREGKKTFTLGFLYRIGRQVLR